MKHAPDEPPFGVSRETEERLRAYVDLLLQWNRRINLVSARSAEDVWRRHVVDSLQLTPLLPGDGAAPLLDIGSGAGFPGLVLAATTGRPTRLVEADKRKAAFLVEASARLGLARVEVHAGRIEDAELPKARLLTARALAPLPALLRHAHVLLSPGGTALFPKGRTAEEELTAASRDWMMRVERFQSRTDPASTIFRISEIRPAGSEA
ncbi:MAG: 16S rRNA (guanine(527)-N(7))-methyltransferase RsmG [Acetobacteraceae bacterium]|nr:16S rRNA (guanine(527)-N(7))-methyltransferase RsmG [Acetobacteraceae bacterium]